MAFHGESEKGEGSIVDTSEHLALPTSFESSTFETKGDLERISKSPLGDKLPTTQTIDQQSSLSDVHQEQTDSPSSDQEVSPEPSSIKDSERSGAKTYSEFVLREEVLLKSMQLSYSRKVRCTHDPCF